MLKPSLKTPVERFGEEREGFLDADGCAARYVFSRRHWFRLVDSGRAPNRRTSDAWSAGRSTPCADGRPGDASRFVKRRHPARCRNTPQGIFLLFVTLGEKLRWQKSNDAWRHVSRSSNGNRQTQNHKPDMNGFAKKSYRPTSMTLTLRWWNIGEAKLNHLTVIPG